MKKAIKCLFVVSALFITTSTVGYAEGESCSLCESVRAYNKTHPENNYEYYEDYLKAQGAKAGSTKAAEAVKPEAAKPAEKPAKSKKKADSESDDD